MFPELIINVFTYKYLLYFYCLKKKIDKMWGVYELFVEIKSFLIYVMSYYIVCYVIIESI